MEQNNRTSEEVRASLWRNGFLKWKLWSQQNGIYEDIRALPKETQTVVVLCARQFGKSFLGTTLGVEDCLRNPGVAVIIVGPTIQQTTDIVNQSLKNLYADAPKGLIRRSKSESRWYVGKSELIIGGFDMKNAATRHRGKSLYRIYIEELVDSNPDTYHESIRSDLGPALTHSKDAKMIYLTTLPKIPDHPFILDTMPQAQLKNAFYSYTIDDNHQLSAEQKQACIDRCGGINTIEYQREYLNKMVRDPSIMVVPHYEELKHVSDFTIPSQCYWHITGDWGGVKDKTCFILHTYDFGGNVELIWDEKVFEPNTDTESIIASLREWIHFEMDHPLFPSLYVDAPGQLLVDLTISHNLPFKMVPKEDWVSCVNQMSMKFSVDGRILVHPRCKFVRQSLRSGTFNKNRTDFARTSALGHCDGLAALMYGMRVQNRLNPYGNRQLPGGVLMDTIKPIMETKKPATFDPVKPRKFGTFK